MPVEISDSTQRRIAWLGFLGESDIANRSDNTLQIDLSNGANLRGVNAYISSYADVDQVMPIRDSGNRYMDNLNAPVALVSPLEVEQGGLAAFVVHVNNAANPPDAGADQFTFTTGVQSGSSGNYSRVAAKSLSVVEETNVSLAFGTVRAGIVGVALQPAAPWASSPR